VHDGLEEIMDFLDGVFLLERIGVLEAVTIYLFLL
jgi:hypothetical protein